MYNAITKNKSVYIAIISVKLNERKIKTLNIFGLWTWCTKNLLVINSNITKSFWILVYDNASFKQSVFIILTQVKKKLRLYYFWKIFINIYISIATNNIYLKICYCFDKRFCNYTILVFQVISQTKNLFSK